MDISFSIANVYFSHYQFICDAISKSLLTKYTAVIAPSVAASRRFACVPFSILMSPGSVLVFLVSARYEKSLSWASSEVMSKLRSLHWKIIAPRKINIKIAKIAQNYNKFMSFCMNFSPGYISFAIARAAGADMTLADKRWLAGTPKLEKKTSGQICTSLNT